MLFRGGGSGVTDEPVVAEAAGAVLPALLSDAASTLSGWRVHVSAGSVTSSATVARARAENGVGSGRRTEWLAAPAENGKQEHEQPQATGATLADRL